MPGHAALLRIARTHRVIEIGRLLFGHAFDTPGVRRCAWTCDALNALSCRAAPRFGFTHEGTFRHHMVITGRNRDTAWLSVRDREWPRAARHSTPGAMRRTSTRTGHSGAAS